MSKRFTTLALTLVLAAAVSTGCKRSQPKSEATIEEGPSLATMIQVGDPKVAAQLVKGFHGVEAGSWRWTAGKFSVTLSPPPKAAERGARLVLRLTVPDPIIQQLSAVKLSASVEGVALPEETFAKPGQYVYSREVPASALAKTAVVVDFALDKSLQPSASDQRELGVVVSAVGFEAK